MKKVVLLLAAMLLVAIPAYAAHGTIRETDTAIIVDYTGDGDGEKPAANDYAPRTTQTAASPAPAATAEPPAASAPVQNKVAKTQPQGPSRFWSKHATQRRKGPWQPPEGYVGSPDVEEE